MAPLVQGMSYPSSPEILQSPTICGAPSNTNKAKKTLTFHRRVTVRHTFHLDSCTEEEKSAMWYTQTELIQMRANVRHEVALLAAGTSCRHHQLELRGLESLLPDGQADKLFHRERARNAVLKEQEYQWERGMNDPDLIADLYFDLTRASVVAARLKGISDHEAMLQQSPPVSPKHPSSDRLFRSGSIGSMQRRQPLGISSRAA